MAYALELALDIPPRLGLPDLRAGGDPAGHARRVGHQPPAGLDAAAVAGDAGGALCAMCWCATRCVLRAWCTTVVRAARVRGFNLHLFGAALTVGIALITQMGEQADYLRFMPAQHAGATRRRWWAGRAGRRAGLGDAWACSRCWAARCWPTWRITHMVPADRAVDPNQMYLAAYEYVFPQLRLGGGGHGAVRGGLAAQDQRHQRLRRLAGLEQLLLAPDAQPPGARGVGGVQHADRLHADGDERVPARWARCWACTPTSPSPGSWPWWPTW